ncbi:uncharacterized protein [Palaemon carinicauda]|uniref:uncharacterized protein n=1 Tax=Palaemon carinicauda TaxID=392227 RepID=UPI0035B6844E
MAGVMYQGYASYLQAYQRHSNPYCPTTPLALNHYDKKYRLQDAAGGGSSQPPTPDLQQQQQQQQQFAAATPSTSSSSSALPNPQTAGAAVSGSTASTPSAAAAAVAAAAAAAAPPAAAPAAAHASVCSSPVASQQQQQSQQPQASVSHSAKSDEKPEQHADAHYISANCVVLTYFSGDLATAVDEHFSRALTQSFSKSSKGDSPVALFVVVLPALDTRSRDKSVWTHDHRIPHIPAREAGKAPPHPPLPLIPSPYFSSFQFSCRRERGRGDLATGVLKGGCFARTYDTATSRLSSLFVAGLRGRMEHGAGGGGKVLEDATRPLLKDSAAPDLQSGDGTDAKRVASSVYATSLISTRIKGLKAPHEWQGQGTVTLLHQAG